MVMNLCLEQFLLIIGSTRGRGNLVVRITDSWWPVMSLSLLPLKTHLAEEADACKVCRGSNPLPVGGVLKLREWGCQLSVFTAEHKAKRREKNQQNAPNPAFTPSTLERTVKTESLEQFLRNYIPKRSATVSKRFVSRHHPLKHPFNRAKSA
ncbi:hypothetical protein TNCV_4368651 [Trichonephila clavipes]|nr:hypothetical protein TNCV_4368651 [Trichonephila clavipes]